MIRWAHRGAENRAQKNIKEKIMKAPNYFLCNLVVSQMHSKDFTTQDWLIISALSVVIFVEKWYI